MEQVSSGTREPPPPRLLASSPPRLLASSPPRLLTSSPPHLLTCSVSRYALGRFPKLDLHDREALGGRIFKISRAMFSAVGIGTPSGTSARPAAQQRHRRIVAVQEHAVVEVLVDPAATPLDVAEVEHHAPRVQAGRLQRNDRPAVVAMQVPALSLVVQQPMAVAEVDLTGDCDTWGGGAQGSGVRGQGSVARGWAGSRLIATNHQLPANNSHKRVASARPMAAKACRRSAHLLHRPQCRPTTGGDAGKGQFQGQRRPSSITSRLVRSGKGIQQPHAAAGGPGQGRLELRKKSALASAKGLVPSTARASRTMPCIWHHRSALMASKALRPGR